MSLEPRNAGFIRQNRSVDHALPGESGAPPAHWFIASVRDNSFAREPLHEPTVAGRARHSVRAAAECNVDCIRGAQGTARPTVAQWSMVFMRKNCFAIKPPHERGYSD
jgi:hypothetical protein